MSRHLAVLSLGGGVQSSTLAEMACDGLIGPLQVICFADTGGELPETYRHIDYLRGRAEQSGIAFLTVSAGNLRRDLVARHGKGGQPNLPVQIRHGDGSRGRLNHYRCSYDYKRRPITRTVKSLCGSPGAWKQTHVQQWIGYSTDEASRMKTADECRCGHNRIRRAAAGKPYLQIHTSEGCTRCNCPRWEPWQVNRWPLIELGMNRDDCTTWLLDHDRPLPPRSSCWFWPNRPAAFHVWLQRQHPELFGQAVALDDFLRHGINGLRGEAYLHPTARPLREAVTDLDEKASQETDDVMAMDCEAGVCFT